MNPFKHFTIQTAGILSIFLTIFLFLTIIFNFYKGGEFENWKDFYHQLKQIDNLKVPLFTIGITAATFGDNTSSRLLFSFALFLVSLAFLYIMLTDFSIYFHSWELEIFRILVVLILLLNLSIVGKSLFDKKTKSTAP